MKKFVLTLILSLFALCTLQLGIFMQVVVI